MDRICDDLEENVAGVWFQTVGGDAIAKNIFFCYMPFYRKFFELIKRVIEVCDVFGIELLDQNKEGLRRIVSWLEDPEKVKSKRSFLTYVSKIKNFFVRIRRETKKLNESLGEQEKKRLNEAIHCFFRGMLLFECSNVCLRCGVQVVSNDERSEP